MGRDARAIHQGAFVWSASQDVTFGSTTTNQFNVRANGGARFVTSGVGMTVDGQTVLTGISSTNISADAIVGGPITNIIVNVPAGTQTLFFTNGILRAVQ